MSTALTPTSYVVLGLLALLGPSTPYDMERWVDGSLGHFWSVPRSQLYGEPARLAAAGLLDEAREQTGRRRRTLSLTDAGRTALQGWLGEPHGSVAEIRDLGLLKLFFGAAAADPAHVTASARAQVEAHRAQLALYGELCTVVEEPHVAATLRLGVAYEQAAVAFWTSVAELGPAGPPTG